MENSIVYDNVTLQDLLQNKPLGWTLINPPIINQYWFEGANPYVVFPWVESKAHWALYAGALYILTIFGFQSWMKNRPAFDLRGPLMYWNGLLGIFSIFAFARMLPSLLYTLGQPQGLYTTICLREGMDVPTGFWLFVFVLAKFVELGDTIFIVLRKRPLLFIQWFHHLVTMIVGWITFPFAEPVSRFYATLNAGVHAVMYPYFSLRAGGVKVPAIIANFITTIQFMQMLVGLLVNVVSLALYQSGYECYRHPLSVQLWSVLYGSFVLLFGKLFYDNVLVGKEHKKVN